MSKSYCDGDLDAILKAAEHWKANCLLSDNSVFVDKSIWNTTNLEEMVRNFIENPYEGRDSFIDKLERQIAPTAPEVKQLAAEILWVMLLCPSNIKAYKKKETIITVWSWSNEPFPENSPWITEKVLSGVGSAGMGYNTNRWREMAFVIRAVLALKKLDYEKRTEILSDGWRLAEWLESIPECNSRQFRYMMLYLLFPDDFERIFGGSDRKKIVVAFSEKSATEVKKLSALEIDRELAAIRRGQEEKYNRTDLDFYIPPLKDIWQPGPTITNTWLFAWNPKNWKWDSFSDDSAATHSGGKVIERWNCSSKKIHTGDKAYLVRIGEDPKGIIAAGTIVTEPYTDKHWDIKRAEAGETCTYVDIEFTRIQNPLNNDPYLTLEELGKISDGKQVWTPQTSGIEIKRHIAEKLNQLWKGKIVLTEPLPPVTHQEPSNLILYGPPGTGKTYALNQMIERYKGSHEPMQKRYEFVTFHQAYSYEDFVEGIRPVKDKNSADVSYAIVPGVFQRIVNRAKADPQHRYAIFIDEINRGNIAKIFGELITLIEKDKRTEYDVNGKLTRGMEVTLPYSGNLFGVPRNLDIFGTMNTADRSIALLDTALRRRFRFKELMPDSKLIEGSDSNGKIDDGTGGIIDLRRLLDAMNRRIRFLLNRDMMLGHAYFMKVKDFASLKGVMLDQIIPLLQEYFYEDWHRIQLVFRDVGPGGEKLEPQIICHAEMDEESVLGFDHDDYESITEYWIAPPEQITSAAIRKIYE